MLRCTRRYFPLPLSVAVGGYQFRWDQSKNWEWHLTEIWNGLSVLRNISSALVRNIFSSGRAPVPVCSVSTRSHLSPPMAVCVCRVSKPSLFGPSVPTQHHTNKCKNLLTFAVREDKRAMLVKLKLQVYFYTYASIMYFCCYSFKQITFMSFYYNVYKAINKVWCAKSWSWNPPPSFLLILRVIENLLILRMDGAFMSTKQLFSFASQTHQRQPIFVTE